MKHVRIKECKQKKEGGVYTKHALLHNPRPNIKHKNWDIIHINNNINNMHDIRSINLKIIAT